jgi:hypothetical protein
MPKQELHGAQVSGAAIDAVVSGCRTGPDRKCLLGFAASPFPCPLDAVRLQVAVEHGRCASKSARTASCTQPVHQRCIGRSAISYSPRRLCPPRIRPCRRGCCGRKHKR